MDMSKINDWLETIPSQATRKSYISGIRTFEKYYQNGVETLQGSKNAGRTIEKFYVWLKEKGYSQNTARVKVNAVIQFLKYFDTPVKYRKSLGIYPQRSVDWRLISRYINSYCHQEENLNLKIPQVNPPKKG